LEGAFDQTARLWRQIWSITFRFGGFLFYFLSSAPKSAQQSDPAKF
jgi:hypothetical protein